MVVGELHILDGRIVPNGRRDDFEHNTSYSALVNHLVPFCRNLAARCRASSALRSRGRMLDATEQRVRAMLRDVRNGAVGERSRRAALRTMDTLLKKMSRLAQAGGLFF